MRDESKEEVEEEEEEEEEEEDAVAALRLVRLNLRPFIRRLASRLVSLGCPEPVVVLVLSVSGRAWLFVVAWYALSRVAVRWDVGQPFILLSICVAVCFGFRKKRADDTELSAYSIFNENRQALPGAIAPEELERQLRAGHFM